MKSCCDHHEIDCREGRDCPARQAAKVWCHTSKQFCTQPYTCASACQLTTANSDGSAQQATYAWELTPLGWVVLAGLLSWLAFVVAAYYAF
ncbi:MAG: hypothetical protein Q7T78_17195 [Rhodoferax sp.]|nr:hypothetical protein [Rhodoferax sp.]